MAYDYAGSWDTQAGHQANLYTSSSNPSGTPFSTVKAVDHYVNCGISASKIVLGMPLYGRAFASTAGPGQSFSGVGEGSWEQGVWDFKALPQAGAKVHTDESIGASWSYDPAKQLMISYDNREIAKTKVDFIRHRGLGGGMWWESSGDKQGHDSLIETVNLARKKRYMGMTDTASLMQVAHGLHKLDRTDNTVSYPESQYDNLRNGCPGE